MACGDRARKTTFSLDLERGRRRRLRQRPRIPIPGLVMTGLQGVAQRVGHGVTGFNATTPLRNGRARGARSIAEDRAWAARLDYAGSDKGLIGVSAYRGNSGQDISQGSEIDGTVALWDAHARARVAGVELAGLYTKGWIHNVDQLDAANGLVGPTSIGGEFFGGYLEAAYNVMPLFKGTQYLAPFMRWERLDTQQSVPDGFSENPANDRTEYTYGLTYKPHPQVVVKATTRTSATRPARP